MGGHPAGEVASGLACEMLETAYYSSPALWEQLLFYINPKFLKNRLLWSFDIVKRALESHEKEHLECVGFGTTLSALVLTKKTGIIAHVGDSRIYRLRETDLSQLTVDDTLVEELIKTGKFKHNNPKLNSYRHVLTQAIGAGGYEFVHTVTFNLRQNDTFLLSTDGLHDVVCNKDIKNIMMQNELPNICSALINSALSHSGEDNITAIVVKII
ncbi:protein-serine/threonine phosphatase PrpC [Desulfothermus okinawensis JCM 13304]